MQIIPHLITQADLYTRIRERTRDTANRRWSQKEVYNAINDGLTRWSNRVFVPFLYTVTGGFTLGDYDYTLPWYISPPVDVQIYRQHYVDGLPIQTNDGSMSTWVDFPAYRLEPDGSGGQVLRLEVVPYDTDARIVWWAQNGPVPATLATLNANISSTTATTCTFGSAPVIGPAGYVKIDDEWLAYAGYTQASSVTTLQNLVRGVNGTTAATHTSGATVYWGIAAHRPDLFNQMYHQAWANMHNLFLQDASPKEIEHHTFQLRFHQQMADEFWKNYVPNRTGRMRLSQAGIGLL